MIFNLIEYIISTTFSTTFVMYLQQILAKKAEKREAAEVNDAVNSTIEKIKDTDNVIDLMIKNVTELREYYVISKQQASKSFHAAIFVSLLGFIVFIAGVITINFSEQNIILFTTISGGIVEIISGLFFYIYKSALNQLNIYHKRLGTTEKYLIAMQLIDKMSDDKKDESYNFLMQSILIDNSSVVRNDKNNIIE